VSVLVNSIRAGFYLDSVALMRLSVRLQALDGVQRASLMLASPANRQILRDADLLTSEGENASADDLVIAIRASHRTHTDAALEAVALWLQGGGSAAAVAGVYQPRSIEAAADLFAEANLALISIPGEYAARQAAKALRLGLNVMMFSDNVSKADERTLKISARSQGLIVMGPDCGSAIIRGVPLAFANAVPRGSIGIVAASGTGLQEVSCLLARGGLGISHAIGTGGRDLSDEIGGITALAAIDLLIDDDSTEHIVLISKPPGEATAARVLTKLSTCAKPVTVCFIGSAAPANVVAGVRFCRTIDDTAQVVLGKALHLSREDTTDLRTRSEGTGVLHGLFAGGTLCAEAQVVCADNGIAFTSNAPIPGAVAHTTGSEQSKLLDLGADEYTVGRPHPMLEPQVRNEVLRDSLVRADVVMLDVVLGFGAHHDPAGAVADVVAGCAATRKALVVASVCGTDSDPQPRHEQVLRLQRAGIHVAESNAQATQYAIDALRAAAAGR
jgi:FdrA protein